MGLLNDAKRSATPGDTQGEEGETPEPRRQGAGTASLNGRETTVSVAGDDVDLEDTEVSQPADEGTWLTGAGLYGRPRGSDAIQQRNIVQTSAMQSIVNGIAGQLLGGELTFEARDDIMDDLSDSEQEAAADLRTLLRDVLEGPHLPDDSLDQLVVAAVEDMLGPGQAVWHLRGSEDGSIPVAALETVDPLTVRMNINRHNEWQDPPFYQAPSAFRGGSVAALNDDLRVVELQADDLVLMDYPYGTRSHKTYPVSPTWQVKEWLEILANSTTHHNRFYDDNQIPPGLLQVVNASQSTIDDIQNQIEGASGDPRDVPIVGGEGGAQWLDMGGTAINLDIIQEQQWFFEMCLGSLGLGKAEVGLIEDVNRANGEIEATRVYKRVGGPFSDQFESAMMKICSQFDAYRELGKPFVPKLRFTDPREERAREERLRQQLEAGAITQRQYDRRTGDTEIAEDDENYEVEINGQTVNYGDHPRYIVKSKLSSLGATDPDAAGGGDDDDGGGNQFARNTVEIGDTTVDLTPPEAMVNAAELAREKKKELDVISDCGTGVGDESARAIETNRAITNDEISGEKIDDIAAYLTSHEEDVQGISDPPTDWSDEVWEGRTTGDDNDPRCGPVQYALWGGTATGTGLDWAQRKANEVARARDEEEPY